MTSLANQLKSLALPHAQAVLGDQRKRVSLLFDPTEAANLDKEAVFAIGIGGLEELIEIDSVFMEYQASVFNESATSLQRLTHTSEVNKKLDETISVFLAHLSPYFLLRPAHKALEWLIYRYQVHFYNIDDLLMCSFPYHDSNIFTRLLQILDLSNTKSKWHWLALVQKHGTQLPCQTIATHAYKDEGFLNFISSIPERFINVHGSTRAVGSSSPVHTAIAFYNKIVLNSIQLASTLKDSFIAQLMTFLLKGLKSRNDEYRCSSYMILSTICSKTSLDTKFLEAVLPLLTKRMTMRNGFEAVSCLVLVFKTQPSLTKLPRRCFKHLCRLPGVVQHLTQLHEWGVLSRFWLHLLNHLVPAAIKDCRLGVSSSSDGGGAGGELLAGHPEYWSLLESLLSDCALEDRVATAVIRLMCDGYVENKLACQTEESQVMLSERVRAMLRLMEQKYSAIVDAEIQQQMESSDDSEEISEFALMSISSFKYKGSNEGVNLALSLNNPTSAVRLHGVNQLAKLLDEESDESAIDKDFVCNALYSRLLDDDLSVAAAVMDVNKKRLLQYLTAQQLVEIIESSKKKVALFCCQLLSEHPDSSAVSADINRLVIISTHLKKLDVVSALTSTLSLQLFSGVKLGEEKWQSEVVDAIAANIARQDSPIAKVEQLAAADSPHVPHIMCSIVVAVCSTEHASDDLRTGALAVLLEQSKKTSDQLKSDDHPKCTARCLRETLTSITKLFQGWRAGWHTSQVVVSSYQTFLSRLIAERRVDAFAAVVRSWLDSETFRQSFITMASTEDDTITLNLLQLVSELPAETLTLYFNDNQTVGCLISLLLNEEKLIRKTVINLLTLLCKGAAKAFELRSLVDALLLQSREIRTDSLHVMQAMSGFLESEGAKASLVKLLETIRHPDTPGPMSRALLNSLESYICASVLVGIEMLLARLLGADRPEDAKLLQSCLNRFDDISAKLLRGKKDLWNLFLKGLHLPSCQQHAMAVVTKQFFDALESLDLKEAVLSSCLDIYLQTEDAGTHSAVTKLVRRVTMPAEMVIHQLETPIRSLDNDQSMKTKKMRRSQPATTLSTMNSVEWRRVRLLLEWLQNKKKINDIHLLVPTLVMLITQVLEMTEEASSDYIKQLLLGCLDNVLSKLSVTPGYKDSLNIEKLNMESVVQCIRTSKNPQTHQQALLVLRTTAKMYPNVVLHHVMSIFTYMGANIMRQDDMYSFQIIAKTLDTVVPEIIKASDESGEYTITGIARVFVDTYPHIPEHRRLPLFVKLLQTVGDRNYLYVCACLCVEAVTTSTVITESSKEFEWKTESNQLNFLMSLFPKFSVASQLEACNRMLEFLCSLPTEASQPGSEASKSSLREKKSRKSAAAKGKKTTDGLFDTELHTDKQLRHFKYECAGFIVSLLASNTFIEQSVNNSEDGSDPVNFNQMVETGLRYIHRVAEATREHAHDATAKFWRALLNKAYEILDKVNSLLPVQVFLDVIEGLLKNEISLIQRKALDLLNNRLPQTVFSKDEMSSLLRLITSVKSLALDNAEDGEDTDDTTNRQTALYSLKIMTRMIAGSDIQPFIQLLPETCEAFDNVHLDVVRANILLLIGELVSQLKVHAVPHLPNIVPRVVSVLQNEALLQSNHLLWISALTALQKMVEAIPSFLSRYLLDIMVIVAVQSSVVTSGGDVYKGYRSQLPVRLKALRETLAKEFSPRVLVPVFIKTYSKISTQKQSIECLMSVVGDHIEHMSKDDLSTHHHKLLELFLLALDYRTTHHEEDPMIVEETENATIRATIKMIVKLSEASFRPMYFKLYGWATRESEVSDRLLTFYRLSNSIAETLRGLFSLFASHIVKNAADVLNSTNKAKTDVASPFTDDTHEELKNFLLCKAVLGCLHKCFLYDTERFITKQRFNILMQPLVDQIENQVDCYDAYIKEHVVPCVGQLVMAAGDDSLWKPLVYQVCLKTRHTSPEVRKGALHVLKNLNAKLGDDFMTLLPETIPFLAELMEDDEEEVEALCQEVIADMEIVLGEPLQKYF